MKKLVSVLLAFVLVLSLAAAAAVPAQAAGREISAVEGHSVSLALETSGTESVTEAELAEGQLPPGLAPEVAEGRLLLTGTPTAAGDYRAVLAIHTSSLREELTLRIRIREEAGLAAFRGESLTVQTQPAREEPIPEETAAVEQPAPQPTAVPVMLPQEAPREAVTPIREAGSTPVPATLTAPVTAASETAAGPRITKHPSGETISANGSAIFVARAEGAEQITWRLVSANGAEAYDAALASQAFSGMTSAGQGTETLTLYGIPSNFDGWQVECRFRGANGAESVSDRATVSVSSNLLAAPTIYSAPTDTPVRFGEQTTLTVMATAPEGCTLKYQWYQTETNNPATILMIEGATTASYTPPENDTTVYYCVSIRSVNIEAVSTVAYTPLASVTYADASSELFHTHDFGTAWRHNAQNHWHECACGERSEYGSHVFQWTETKRATSRRDGEKVGVCTICGYEVTEVIPSGRSQSQSQSSRPSRGLLIALVIVVCLLLAAMAAYYFLRGGKAASGSRGRRSAGPTVNFRAPDLSKLSGSLQKLRKGGDKGGGRHSRH